MSRFLKLAVVTVLAPAGSIVAVSPASAASYVTIKHASSYACLDQTFNTRGPTVDVSYRPSTCYSKGSLRWRFEYIGGNNWHRIINSSGWCLSAPNGAGSRVFAESCDSAGPPKKIWRPYLNGINGLNRLENVGAGNCLERLESSGTLDTPGVRTCTGYGRSDGTQDFIFFTA